MWTYIDIPDWVELNNPKSGERVSMRIRLVAKIQQIKTLEKCEIVQS